MNNVHEQDVPMALAMTGDIHGVSPEMSRGYPRDVPGEFLGNPGEIHGDICGNFLGEIPGDFNGSSFMNNLFKSVHEQVFTKICFTIMMKICAYGDLFIITIFRHHEKCFMMGNVS